MELCLELVVLSANNWCWCALVTRWSVAVVSGEHKVFVCLFDRCFTPKQHLRSSKDGYQLVAVRTHGDSIVLPYWETRLPEP